jgi:hypothetical protein
MAAAFTGYEAVVVGPESNKLMAENERLQMLLYNYTTEVFVYPDNELVVDLTKGGFDNGLATVTVVIVSPHYGYATISQTKFTTYGPAYSQLDNVTLDGQYITAVPQGSLQKTIDLRFMCMIYDTKLMIAPQGGFYLGTVTIKVTFHDVQLNTTYANATSIPIKVLY